MSLTNEIKVLTESDVDIIKKFIIKIVLNFWLNYPKIVNPEKFQNESTSDILNLLRKKQTTFIGSIYNSDLNGIIILEYMDWDTNYFKFPVYRVKYVIGEFNNNQKICNKIINYIIHEKIKIENKALLLFQIPVQNKKINNSISQIGASFIDIVIDLVKKLHYSNNQISSIKECVEINDVNKICKIAYKSFSLDRFHRDENFSVDTANQFHYDWVKNSCSGQAANKVFMSVDTKNEPSGFITLKINPNISLASIILIAVDANCQRKGMGKQLIQHSENWLSTKVKIIDVRTQIHNTRAINFYIKKGYCINNSFVNWHYWYNNK